MIEKWNEILLCTTAISHRIHSGAVLLRRGVSFKLASLITMHAEWLVGCFQPLPSSEQSWQAAFGAPVLPQAVCVCVPGTPCQLPAQGCGTGQGHWQCPGLLRLCSRAHSSVTALGLLGRLAACPCHLLGTVWFTITLQTVAAQQMH